MKVEKKLVKKWKVLRSKGDVTELAKLGDVSTVTIRTVLRDGECSEQLFKVVADFYEKRTELIKQYI